MAFKLLLNPLIQIIVPPYKLPVLTETPALRVVMAVTTAVLGTLQKSQLPALVMHCGKLSGLFGPVIMHVLYLLLLYVKGN